MRAGLSTIQQTLTSEASSVLNHSIAEAGRRNHGQTTPLHVAATLLASPTGFLRQACIKSHPNSSHPLQCRALELCFSVALERLPTANGSAAASGAHEPPISNALMAALKRAQAHQRRGCPEQQQQPLLAVKVELEQLIISILDDPSVSRVMREASFSSPAVKQTIENTISNSSTSNAPAPVGTGFRPPGIYLNPRLGGGVGVGIGEEVKRVVEILSRRGRKRNPVLVGDSEPDLVVKEVIRRIESREFGGEFGGAEIVHVAAAEKVKEVVSEVEARLGGSVIVLNLGDLKWLVEQPASEVGRGAVAEIGKLIMRFDGRVWLIGTATCETYLRCQVYHPSMENDWDLQAVPIAARAPVPGLFPRLGGGGGTNGILSSSVESLSSSSPMKAASYAAAKLNPPRLLSENSDPSRKTNFCPMCSQSYEQELAKLVKESEKPSLEIKAEGTRPALPLWLQNAKPHDSTDRSEKNQEVLQKKWSETCLKLHPSFHHNNQPRNFGSERITPTPKSVSLQGLYSPNNLLVRQPFQNPKLQMNKSLGGTLQLNTNPGLNHKPSSDRNVSSPPGSPVRTDLVLGQTKGNDQIQTQTQTQTHSDRIKDLIGCQRDEKVASKLDADSFKRLSKGLAEKVWWQPEAAVSMAATMTECRVESAQRRRGAASKGDMWVLFLGPDRVGKRKMASALADLVSGSSPVTISLGSRRETETGFRGKTVVDKIVEAVRRNPFSVILLEDVNEADALVKSSIKRAMERGRLSDTHGREVSLGNVVFVLTADWLPENLRPPATKSLAAVDEERLARLARRPWQLRLAVNSKIVSKRRGHWLDDESRPRKKAFDLNEAAAVDPEDDHNNNSSEVTIDDNENGNVKVSVQAPPPPREILEAVDDTIVFKTAEPTMLRDGIANTVSNRFASVIGDVCVAARIEMDEDALENILSGLWLGKTSLEEWTETVLVPGFRQLRSSLSLPGSTTDEPVFVRLESDGEDSIAAAAENRLPSSIRVVLTDH